MKLIGIVGSNADSSYNRLLLQYIGKEFYKMFDLEILEIKDIPMFNQSKDQTNSVLIQNMNRKILQADGVIIATPEHNHTIPAGLKSVLEWLSFKIHPLENKPVMIVGCSYYDQGTSRAQLHLRQILDAPGVNAIVMPGNEFLLGKAKEAFDENGNLIAEGTRQFLESTLQKFVEFIDVISKLEGAKPKDLPEDLHAKGTIETTIEGVDMAADDWVEQAAEAVQAVEFLYYNKKMAAEEMFAKRQPGQVGNPLANCHPPKALKNVEWVIQQLRSGKTDAIRVHVPMHGPDTYVVHNYQAMYDDNGNYAGINEYILDFKPIVDWYLKQTGQELVGGKNVDAVSGASKKEAPETADSVSSASVHEEESATEKPTVDSVSSASIKE